MWKLFNFSHAFKILISTHLLQATIVHSLLKIAWVQSGLDGLDSSKHWPVAIQTKPMLVKPKHCIKIFIYIGILGSTNMNIVITYMEFGIF